MDLNCDLGEGAGRDEELMPLVTSANIACGGHAGDVTTMHRTLELARRHGVAPGAHPGYCDRPNFGRVEQKVTPAQVFDLVQEQIRRLSQIAVGLGMRLAHVKPHGALYNQAARDVALAQAVAAAVAATDPQLILFGLAGGDLAGSGLAGSQLITAGKARGLATASEIFADRRYQADGSLTPRTSPDALISDPHEACDQVLRWIREGRAQTICVHGDTPHAVTFVRRLRSALEAAGVEIKSCRA